MTDIASLGIELDTRQVVEGTRALDTLGETSKTVEQKMGAMNGQMNDTAKIMKTQAEAASAAAEASQKFLEKLQREIDLFGANRAEAERYNAAVAGLSGTTQQAAAALGAKIDAMQREEKAARDAAAAEDQMTKAGDRFIKSLQDQVATIGMTTSQLQAYRAAQLGVSDAAAPLIKSLADTGAGAKGAGGHMDGFSLSSVGARRELLVLAHEMSQGNFQKFGGSLMVLGEQTGAASLLFSAMGLSIIGVVGTLGLLAAGMIHGASEQKHMADALLMTDNYAGLTSDSLNALAHAAVEAGGSLGEAKKVATELAGSGKFTGEQISYITEATVAWEHATGQSTKSIIASFESLAVQSQGNSMRATEAISRATLKLDDTYHFLTESVYEQIRALEKEGDAKAASVLATETFAKVVKDRAEESAKNLGKIAKVWNEIKEAAGAAADAVGAYGARATPATAVKTASFKLDQFDKGSATIGITDPDKLPASLAAARLKIVKELTDAVSVLNQADAAANAQADKVRAQSAGAHAAAALAANDAKHLKETKLELALASNLEYEAAVRAANPASPLITAQAIEDRRLKAIKDNTEHPKGADDRSAVMQGALAREQANFEGEKSIYDARVKMLDTYHSKMGLSDADFYAGRTNARAGYIAAEAISYARELAIVQSYQPKNAEEIAANKNKYDELVRQHKKFVADMRNGSGDDSANAAAAEIKSFNDIAKATIDAGVADGKRLDDAIIKQKEHNYAIGKTKEQIDLEKQAVFDLDTAQKQSDAEFLRGVVARGGMDEKAMAIYAIRLNDLDAEIAKRKVLSGLVGDAATADSQAASAAASRKLADQAIGDWQRVGGSIADSLTNAFGAGGKAIGQMFKAYAEGQSAQLRAQKELNLAKKLQDSDPEKAEAIARAQLQGTQAQLKSYGDMADAAQSFFEQGSKGYQAMHAASVVLHGAEVALSLVKGVNAVLTQGEGDPYSAFGRMAAMAAIVVGLGVALSGGGGSGGGQSAADVQKTQGTGSVFGNSTAKSDSIARSIALSAANSDIELNYTAGMLASLQAIEASMSGLTNLIVRTTGLTDGKSFGIQEGQINKGAPTDLISSVMTGVTKALFGPGLGGSIAGFINNLWGKTTQNIVDSGIQLGGSVRDLQSGSGFQQYASVDTTKSSWFGLSKSTSNSVKTAGLSNELSTQFGLIFTNLESALKVAATGIGIGAGQVESALGSLRIDTTKVSLKGLTGDDLTAAINGVISKTMDQMAEAAIPGLDKFRRVGEGYAETVVRIATDYAKLDGILGGIGMTFGAVGIGSISARENLIQLAGGIDALASQTKGFASNFLSQAEQLAPVQKYVNDQLAAMGLSGIKTRDDFKKVVLGLDLTQPAAQQTYASLMALQDAFAKTHAAAVDLTKSESEIADQRADLQKQIDQATLTSAQLRAKERLGIDASNLAMFDMVTNLQTIASTSDALKTSIDKLKAFKDGILSFRDSLTLGTLSTLTPSQKAAEAQRQYEAMLAKARGGDAAAQAGIQGAATAYLTTDQIVKASSDAYVADAMEVQADLAALAAIAGTQMTDAQQQLDKLDRQVSEMVALNATASAIAAATQAQVSVLSNFTNPTASSMAPLVEEIKGLRSDNERILAENTALREAVQEQTNVVVAATFAAAGENAKSVNDGAKRATSNRNYKQTLYDEAVWE